MRFYRGEHGPCDCPMSLDLEHGDPHTLSDHDGCGGWGYDPPCGGCHDCVAAQWAHYDRLAKEGR